MIGAGIPLPRCQFPELQKLLVDGVEWLAMDKAGLKQQLACQVTEEENHDIAVANAAALIASQKSYNAVIETTRRDHALAEFEINEIDHDRREATIEAWGYKGLLAVVLIAVAL